MGLVLSLTLTPTKSYAFSDGSGWAMFPYVVKMVYEAYKRYTQLQLLVNQGQVGLEYQKLVNAGLDQVVGLMGTLPIQNEHVLEGLRDIQRANRIINELYGIVPRSGEAAMQLLHDQTIAESLKVSGSISEYTAVQEANAAQAFQMANVMSPKGAARLSVSTQAQILHALSQLIKVDGQILKLQSEELAMSNKQSKDSVGHFNKINTDMQSSMDHFSGDFSIPRF